MIHYSYAVGRPVNALKRHGYRYTWCAWWKGEPTRDPFRRPDAAGGARTADEIPEIIRQHMEAFRVEGPVHRMSSCWARAFRNIERDLPPWETRAAARKKRVEWTVTTLDTTSPPDWAVALDLSWPDFDEAAVRQAWRKKAAQAHPDAGGSSALFIDLTRARDAAMAYLSRRA